MSNKQSIRCPVSILGLAVAVNLACGCASSSNDSSAAPKPGKGIAEYREVVNEAHRSVKAVVDALPELPNSFTPPSTSSTRPAFARFDKALHELELTSMRTRARAEAIIARGESYFEEWKGNLSGMTNQATARVESERYTRMRERFERVRQCSGEVRAEFRPFMTELRQVRARFDQPAKKAATDTRKDLEDLTGRGMRVLQALDLVSTALNEAESALRAMR